MKKEQRKDVQKNMRRKVKDGVKKGRDGMNRRKKREREKRVRFRGGKPEFCPDKRLMTTTERGRARKS